MSGSKASPIYYWDSCLFIAWLTDEQRPAGEIDGLKKVVDAIERRKATMITSTLTIAEITEKKVGAGVWHLLEDLLKRPNVQRLSVDSKVAGLARDLRDYYWSRPNEYNNKTLSVPDAIHLAAAILYKVDEFQTFDRSNRKNSLGLIPLSGDVAGHDLAVRKPHTSQLGLDLK